MTGKASKRFAKQKGVFERKVKPWLLQKSIELMEEKEESFIQLVLKLLQDRSEAEHVVEKLEKIFFEETEPFVKKLWRFIHFEQLKIKAGFV